MKVETGALVFVTPEPDPSAPGKINHATHSLLKSLTPDDLKRCIVLLASGSISRPTFEDLFPGAELWQISGEPERPESREVPEQFEGPCLLTSYSILQMLRQIAERRSIRYVEFPDWNGLGFATIQEKLATGFLSDAVIAVRLHTTEAILALREARSLSTQDLGTFDLERKCYRDCDAIVTHLRSVAEEVRECFGFSNEEWWPRVVVAPTPVDLEGAQKCLTSIQPNTQTAIVFASEFREINRPAIFLQAAVGFLLDNPKYQGEVVLACNGLALDYPKSVVSQVPAELLTRVKLLDGERGSERDAVMSMGIVVFPGVFEACCLEAYEASLRGAVVVVNEVNPAFAEGSPWIDGVNCLKFAGSARSLQGALERAFILRAPMMPVGIPPAIHPWHLETAARASHQRGEGSPLVTAVIVNQNEGALLSDTLESVLAQGYRNLEIIVVDDGSRDAFSKIMVGRLGAGGDAQVKCVSLSATAGRGAAMNYGIGIASGEYIVRMQSGDLLRPHFVEAAVSALTRHRDFDVYCSQVAYYQDIDLIAEGDVRFDGFVGEALASGSHVNLFAKGPWVGRRALFEEVPFRTNLGILWNWGWMYDIVARGSRVICAPRAETLLRDRSQIDASDPTGDEHLLDHLVVSGSPFPRHSFPVADLALACRGASYRHVPNDWPDWYTHMMENGYEPEMSFVGGILGHTRLGRLIRSNSKIAGLLERFLTWSTRVPPGVS